MYKINVGKHTFEFSKEDIDVLDIHHNGDDIHLISNSKSYNIRCLSKHLNQKKYKLEVNEEVFEVVIEDKCDQLVSQLGFSTEQSKVIKEITAPMPGLVLDILANVGDTVNEGDSIIILEAMKMENILKAPIAGTIKAIHVKQSDPVDKSQILLEFE